MEVLNKKANNLKKPRRGQIKRQMTLKNPEEGNNNTQKKNVNKNNK